MKTLRLLLILPLFLFAGTAFAQEDCGGDSMAISLSDAGSLMAPAEPSSETALAASSETSVAAAPLTRAEASVKDIISGDGLHVVHFWAPWCSNSKNELGAGWSDLIEDHSDVTFTFVTIWNEGRSGAKTMNAYNIPVNVKEITAQTPDGNGRIDEFLGLPVTWVPSTWIFHDNGELAFAMNYAEMDMETIDHLLALTTREW